MRKSAIVICLCSTMAFVQAQKSGGGGGAMARGGEGSPHGGPPTAYRGGTLPNTAMLADPRFTARLFQIRSYRIQQGVGLPEDRARALAERWGRWDQEHLARGQQAADIRDRFNQILMGPDREEEKNAKLKPLMDQFMSLRQQQEEGRHRFEEDIRQGLTAAQQARLILVMDEINQKLREGLHDVRGR